MNPGSNSVLPRAIAAPAAQGAVLAETILTTGRDAPAGTRRLTVSYAALWCFMLVYCSRPNDWIPGAAVIPFAKITGFLALAGFVVGVLLQAGGLLHLPREALYLVLLYVQLCLAVPFAIYHFGAFELVVFEFWKVIVIALVIGTAVTSMARLCKLLFVETASVGLITVLSVAGYGGVMPSAVAPRLMGVVGGVFDNPNDFALSIALVFPFCFWFALRSKSILRKAFWISLMAIMIYTVLLTYSRSGLLALLAGGGMAIWEFGVKAKRHHWIIVMLLMGLTVSIVGGPAAYVERVKSIFDLEDDPSGSAVARRELFIRGLKVTAHHPIWGVGPNNFPIAIDDPHGHGTHNTYLQFSAEAGIPALIFFLLIVQRAFFNVRRVQRAAPSNSEFWLTAGALRASLAAFVVGAFFADTAYQFFSYFLMGYSSALYQIACASGVIPQQASQPTHQAGAARQRSQPMQGR